MFQEKKIEDTMSYPFHSSYQDSLVQLGKAVQTLMAFEAIIVCDMLRGNLRNFS
jgi:hypothetical protein